MAKGKKILAVDIGSNSVKIVEFFSEGLGGRSRITNFCQAPVNGQPHEQVIQELLKKHGIKTRRAVTAVSGRSVIVRYISIPPTADADLRKVVRNEADKYIPFDLAEVALDCQKIEEEAAASATEIKVLLVAVKKDVIEKHIQMLKGAGLTPAVIDVDAFALGNAYEMMTSVNGQAVPKEKAIALVDIGASKTNVNILRGNHSYFTREIYTAGGDLTNALVENMGIAEVDAEALKCNPGDRIEEVKQHISAILDDLTNEIRLCFDYFENQFDHPVDEVYLSGGSSMFPGIKDIFSLNLEKPVDLWSPVENMDADSSVDLQTLKNSVPRLAVCMGLAARVTG